jgi:hypothetical protein
MSAIIRFYKMSFVLGAHGAAVSATVFAIKAVREGNLGGALTFGIFAGLLALGLVAWWINRLVPE